MDQDAVALPDVLTAPSVESDEVIATPSSRAGLLKGAGIIATGLVAGALGVAALQGNGSSAATNAANTSTVGRPQGQGGPPGFGGPG